MELTLHQEINKVARKTYGQVNRMWPDELPILEKDEAERAYKKLVAKFGKKETVHPTLGWVKRKMTVRRWRYKGTKTWYTRVRKCWLSLNGDTNTLSKGWRRLVHDVSHYVHDFRFPHSRDHDLAQAKIEQEMSQYVIDSGWLDGKLKSKPKVKPTKDEKKLVKVKNLCKLISSWEKKEKTAQTYLKKYRLKLKRLNKN